MKQVLSAVLCLLILGGGAFATWWIQKTEPKAEREGAVKQSAMLVETTEAREGDYEPDIVAFGTVQAARDVRLRPLVGGQIVFRDPLFTPGRIVHEGEVLVRIDPADFENVLEQRGSQLAQAEADLALEAGRQKIARRDYEMLDERVRLGNEDLALRKPQLLSAEAQVKSARAAVAQAELDLARTAIKAPFDAQVLTRNTDLGTRVDPGDDLGRLVCLDEYWVVAAVPQTMLRWIEFPGREKGRASSVRIRNRAAWPEGQYRRGEVAHLLGALDETTRMARVLVVVPDPLARAEGPAGRPPLIIGSVVQAKIKGRPLERVIRVRRDHLRTGDTVWTMEEGKLVIRPVEVAFRDAEHAYVSGGLEAGTAIVTTNLATVAAGAPLRTGSEMAEEDDEE